MEAARESESSVNTRLFLKALLLEARCDRQDVDLRLQKWDVLVEAGVNVKRGGRVAASVHFTAEPAGQNAQWGMCVKQK